MAHAGLAEWNEAKEAFAKAMELEPDDKTIQTSWAQVLHHTAFGPIFPLGL
jgi:cytochrome c-type biogenesis protein CcmH/NrfG